MANQLKMAMVQAILRLHALGWSQRRIARELAIDRETVRRYVGCGETAAKPAISPAGSVRSKPATFSPFPGPAGDESDPAGCTAEERDSKPAISPAGSCGSKPAIWPAGSWDEASGCTPAVLSRGGTGGAEVSGDRRGGSADSSSCGRRGRTSHCTPFRAVILQKLAQQLSVQRIFQDLRSEHSFGGGYDSVKRFVRRLGPVAVLPVWRMECAAGAEAQVDFGTGAWLVAPDGKRRRSHVFRVVLSHSRKGYSEATTRQTTEDFIRCLENAFAHFGGVPQTLVIDNLKAAVAHPDWFDPELTPKLQSFCQHYGTVILPTRPRTPRHKGKIERGIGYVKGNALKARQFTSLEAENRHLAEWEATVADTRIHGTTRQQVGRVFADVERAALLPLPLEFLDEHPIIRPLDDYAAVVAAALQRTAQRQRRDGNKEEEEEDRVFSGMTEQKHVAVSFGKNVAASPKNKTASMVATTEAAADLLPPRSGYPSSGCSPAEPDSVSPDSSSVTFDRPVHQFHPPEDTP